jgi:hypothetical protein
MDSAGDWLGLRWMGRRLRRRMLATVSEELGPRLSIGGVELERLALLGKCPSAPLGKNDRAVRGDPRGGHTC